MHSLPSLDSEQLDRDADLVEAPSSGDVETARSMTLEHIAASWDRQRLLMTKTTTPWERWKRPHQSHRPQ